MYGITIVLGLTAQCVVHALPSDSLRGIQQFLSPDTASIRHDEPIPASNPPAKTLPQTARQLTGKFLHITDFHPDPYYKVYSNTDDESTCHRNKGPAGYYGAETSGCDSPIHLINSTFDWLKQHIRDEVDFVIWTGDSARHDNDEGVPRSSIQIVEQNAFIVEKWREAFGKKENWDDDDPNNDFVVPIVPTLGNNDVMPHNIFEPGPNAWTARYLDMWRQFIPEEQRHQFQRGGWFSVEVIPNKLVVISLNTLYFFASNSAVDGCARKSEPGYEQFDWLRVQLNMLRARGMKAIIIGHVPPARVEAKVSWVESCWQKYALWMRMYRDVVITGLYGHMNIDHFMLQDWEDVKGHIRKGYEYDSDDDNGVEESPSFSVMSAQDYLVSLRDKFARVPVVKSKDVEELDDSEDSKKKKKHKKKKKKHGKLHKKPKVGHIGGQYGERYSVSLVSPSVIPNYFPTIRIYEYNITGLGNVLLPAASSFHRPPHDYNELDLSSHTTSHLDLRSIPQHDDDILEEYVQSLIQNPPSIHADKKKKKKKKPKPHKFRLPKAPSKSTPPGPAYSPQPLTIVSYTQYYANLTHLNNDYVHNKPKKDKTAPDSSTNWPQQLFDEPLDVFGGVDEEKWRPGKHHGKKPPKKKTPEPKPFMFEVEYNTTDDKIFGLKDLTVRSYLDLAAKIAASRKGGKSDIETEDEQVDRVVLDQEALNGGDKHKNHQNHVWLTFLKRAFVSTVDEDDLEDQFEI